MGHVFNPENKHRLNSEQRKKLLPVDSIFKKIRLSSGEALLDLGVGTGYFAIPALECVGKIGRVIAVDSSLVMLEELKKNSLEPDNLEIHHVDIREVDLQENIADKILIAFVLHEVPNQKLFLNSIKKFLKSDGSIIIIEWKKMESEIGPVIDDRIGKEEVLEIMSGCGYKNVLNEDLNEFQYMVTFKIN